MQIQKIWKKIQIQNSIFERKKMTHNTQWWRRSFGMVVARRCCDNEARRVIVRCVVVVVIVLHNVFLCDFQFLISPIKIFSCHVSFIWRKWRVKKWSGSELDFFKQTKRINYFFLKKKELIFFLVMGQKKELIIKAFLRIYRRKFIFYIKVYYLLFLFIKKNLCSMDVNNPSNPMNQMIILEN
jgi:hypothetical protein